jgi:hypothetical protein
VGKELTVDLVREDGRTTKLSGRAARISLWLVANQERINHMERDSLMFHCSGTSIHVVIEDKQQVGDVGSLLRDLRAQRL